jgi:STE24 endopeptidase
MGHLIKGILASTLGTFAIIIAFSFMFEPAKQGFLAIDFQRFFLCLVLFSILVSYVTTPVSSFVSRKHEVEADEFSLELTGDVQSFTSAMIGLARANLSDVSPPPFIRWFAFSHPTTMERIALAEQFKNTFPPAKDDY